MFVTRRSPMAGKSTAQSSKGPGEAILFILAGLGAIGGLAWIFTEL